MLGKGFMSVVEERRGSPVWMMFFGFMLAAAATGCTSDDEPPTASTSDGGSNTQAECDALTPPALACPCICRECTEVATLCFNSPDCPPVVECAQRSGCRSNAECLEACGAEIAAHEAGVSLAQNFGACFGPKCGSACTPP
jgi:hypothetical protein